MIKEEFEKEAYKRGYNTKALIKKWIELNPKRRIHGRRFEGSLLF